MELTTGEDIGMDKVANGRITAGQAVDLLTRTSTNNYAGIIAGPHSPVGYTLTGAIRMLKRCDPDMIVICNWRGDIQAIVAQIPGHGAHVWYINLEAKVLDPWA